MAAQLSTPANKVTQVSLEVGTEGILGGQAFVPDVLTDNVNLMAMNLTNKVRSIAEVAKAVAGGALMKVIEVDDHGEILELKETVNGMTGSLSVFADEVTRVATSVSSGFAMGAMERCHKCWWKDLTDNINVMANNVSGRTRSRFDF
ncbi:hypothetical protein BYT27DRAFT_7186840 [Phlegmacium glaucopus]|nr:hypothetical protein BYT27DRAFT_7186840 [Phlegmacium glaucopus]